VVGDDFSLYYDSYSVDERVDSDSKVSQSASGPGLTLQSFQFSLFLFLPFLFSEPLPIHCPMPSTTISSVCSIPFRPLSLPTKFMVAFFAPCLVSCLFLSHMFAYAL
jgi:hypothetical protein